MHDGSVAGPHCIRNWRYRCAGPCLIMRSMKTPWILGILMTLVLACVGVGCAAVRSGYESAPYKVVRSKGRFEVREYPALKVVETRMIDQGGGSNGGFRRLFKFITGDNEAGSKISMTTPVFMSGAGTNATMAFVMPARLQGNEVPRPKNEAVSVRELEPGSFAKPACGSPLSMAGEVATSLVNPARSGLKLPKRDCRWKLSSKPRAEAPAWVRKSAR